MWENLKIRASAVGKVMTNGRAKNSMGATCTGYLKELYIANKYDRSREYGSKYIDKGLNMEQDALTLLALEKKYPFKKNELHLENEYLTGTPDAFIGSELTQAEEGFDVKCSWDLWTFPIGVKELDRMYHWQNMAYMALTGAKKWTTAYCLLNANASMIRREKERIWYALGCPSDSNDKYIEKLRECEKNMIFNITQFLDDKDNAGYNFDIEDWQYDIPRSERIIEFVTWRDEFAIGDMYARIKECREYGKQNFGEQLKIGT